MGSFTWRLSLGIFRVEASSWELSLEDFTWEPQLGNTSLGMCAWECSRRIFSLGTSARELSLSIAREISHGNLRLITFAQDLPLNSLLAYTLPSSSLPALLLTLLLALLLALESGSPAQSLPLPPPCNYPTHCPFSFFRSKVPAWDLSLGSFSSGKSAW